MLFSARQRLPLAIVCSLLPCSIDYAAADAKPSAVPVANQRVDSASAPSGRAETGVVEGRVLNVRNGEYVGKARVAIEGMSLETFTDSTGYYRLSNVPAGSAKVSVFFTGLDRQSDTVVVSAGGTAQHDFNLSAIEQRPEAGKEGVVRLSEFVVGASREMEGSAIAINERRFAPNFVNVLSTDEFGAMPDGSVGEFLKFIPGITIDYTGGIANTISIDGVPSSNVPVTVAGFNMATTSTGDSSNRQTELLQVSINNVSRVEVVLSPTPESPASALAGSVNLVPRSAFERVRPQFNFNTYLTMRDNERSLHQTPGPRGLTHHIRPGFDLSYIRPVNQRFGFTLSAGFSDQYTPEDRASTEWRGVSAATNGAAFPNTTPDRPYLTRFTVGDYVKFNSRSSASVTADYKLSSRDRVSFTLSYGSFSTVSSNHDQAFIITRVAAFSPTSTLSTPGGAELASTQSSTRERSGFTYTPTLTYRHDGPVWKAEAGAGVSRSTNKFNAMETGIFNGSQARRTNLTIAFDRIFYLRPGGITVTDGTTGAPVDPYNLSNYALNTANDAPSQTKDLQRTAYANLRRDFNVLGTPLTLKGGLDLRQQVRDARGGTIALTFQGKDHRATTTPTDPLGSDDNASVVLDDVFSQRIAPYGFPRIQWVSNPKLLQLYQSNPDYFVRNANTDYRNEVTGSKRSQEVLSSFFLRGDAAFFEHRLKLVGGVRVEQTNINAVGPLTDPTGNFRRDASGNVIDGNPTTAGVQPVLIFPTTDALNVSRLTLLDRGYQSKKEYLRAFPSLNASYNVRENLILRSAHYYSIGRPNFSQYSGGLTLPDTEQLPSTTNRISVNNAGIKPWTARTTQVRLEYYFQRGASQVSVGAFRRDYKNFFGSTTFPATPEFLALYGLDPQEYGPYAVATNYNLTDTVRSEGLQFDINQTLGFLPHWLGTVQIRANATALRNTGAATANFPTVTPRTYNGSIFLRKPKYSLRAAWNYATRRRGAEVTGTSIEPGTYNYFAPRAYLDVEGQYYFWRNLSLYANLRNVKDQPIDREVFGPNTPEHAQLSFRSDFGSLWTFGVRGTF
jgi:TonB-dependent receptor